MHIKPISIKGNSLIQDYRKQHKNALQFFHYNPYQENVYEERLSELSSRSFKRDDLTKALVDCNEKWGASNETFENIERLKDESSVVVVGGQQAGLLTGPLYTIHKIISIIKLAKEQESKLGVPVIPVFWIAGEDHDFQEINHIALPIAPRMKKYKILQRQLVKEPVSSMMLDKQVTSDWVDNIFTQLKETANTNGLKDEILSIVDESDTYVDFFAKIIFTLFPEDGIVLLDSNDPNIRQIESDYFENMINKQDEIALGVRKALNDTSNMNYTIALDAERDDGHLFYQHNGERVLLRVNETGNWVGKADECELSKKELIAIAQKQPQLLSNNVVTRPAMQDLLLPVLSFIGGPGEIAYWSVLKPVFEALEIKMPPVVPRLSFTLMDRKGEKYLEQLALKVSEIIINGVAFDKGMWLKRQTNPPIEELADHVKMTIEKAHQPLKEIAKELQADLGSLAEKNLVVLLREVEYLEQRIMYQLHANNQNVLQKFDWLEVLLHPEGGLQERIWNVYYWINEYGNEWIKDLINQDVKWDEAHYLVYL